MIAFKQVQPTSHKVAQISGLKIGEVNSKADWKLFLKLPWKIYKNDPAWVPPLLSEQKKLLNIHQNPFHTKARYKAWIVFDDKEICGRIVAYVNERYNSFHHTSTGFFGFFESIDSTTVTGLLISTASSWLKEQGINLVQGPINFDIGNECGILLKGYEFPPYLQMAHTPAYYVRLLEEAGCKKAHDLLAFRIQLEYLDKTFVSSLEQLTKRVQKKKAVTTRPFSLRDFKGELDHIQLAYNDCMNGNWGYAPVSKEDVAFTGESLKPLLHPNLIWFAQKDSSVAGCSISLPDVNQVLARLNGRLFPFGWVKFLWYRRKVNRARLLLLCVRDNFRNKGLDSLFYYRSLQEALLLGYKEAELSWVSEDNKVLISIIEKFGAELYKKYRIYQKKL